MTCRTRFAPSPTGYLHIGGARTALYCWLYSKKHHGQFILRIEDTDKERSTQVAVQAILDAMDWLGMDYDEGPFYQSDRMDRYNEVLEQLLSTNHAYRCYCSKERLEKLRADQIKNHEKPRYDGHCRDLTDGDPTQPHVVRFRNPQSGEVAVDDLVRGHVVFQNSELDDLILVRTDGVPTYNFSVVVDDMDMAVNRVIRGADHLNNTPRQINIWHALGKTPPAYAHVSMILGDDGKRLSKRHGAVSVMEYRNDGFVPEAVLNYLVRLGWSHGDQEIFTREEMIEYFDFAHVSKGEAVYNPSKLLWLNQQYLMHLPPERVAEHCQWHFEHQGIDINQGPPLTDLVVAQRERCKTLVEMVEKSRYFYEEVDNYDEKAAKKHLKPDAKTTLDAIRDQLVNITTWDEDSLHGVMENVVAALDSKLGKVAQPVRVALTGGTVSPSIKTVMALLGKDRVLMRLQKALDYIAALG